MDYEEMYKKVLREKFELRDQVRALTEALLETQRALRSERLANEIMSERLDGGDGDDE